MEKLLRKILVLIFVAILISGPSYAANKINMVVKINHEFDTNKKYEEIEFKAIKKTTILDNIVIPQRSIIYADVLESQKERRWHKSGFIVCKLKYFITDYYKEIVDLEDKNIYLIARKYEKINGKEAAITGSEIVLSQAASFFAPGVDILYFFTKGAIQRNKHPNWFIAGIHNAYDNSIFWFWLKGKPIDLDEEDLVSLKEVKAKRAYKLKSQIEHRKTKRKKFYKAPKT